MDEDGLLAAFEACTVLRPDWTHEAHVRVAWIYARRERLTEQVCRLMREGIRRLGNAFGTGTTRYHETVTVAFSAIITERAAQSNAADWDSFKVHNADLFDRDSPILLKYYSHETLYSDAARAQFVPPDLRTLPFSMTLDEPAAV